MDGSSRRDFLAKERIALREQGVAAAPQGPEGDGIRYPSHDPLIQESGELALGFGVALCSSHFILK
jgi:hypothetical protein